MPPSTISNTGQSAYLSIPDASSIFYSARSHLSKEKAANTSEPEHLSELPEHTAQREGHSSSPAMQKITGLFLNGLQKLTAFFAHSEKNSAKAPSLRQRHSRPAGSSAVSDNFYSAASGFSGPENIPSLTSRKRALSDSALLLQTRASLLNETDQEESTAATSQEKVTVWLNSGGSSIIQSEDATSYPENPSQSLSESDSATTCTYEAAEPLKNALGEKKISAFRSAMHKTREFIEKNQYYLLTAALILAAAATIALYATGTIHLATFITLTAIASIAAVGGIFEIIKQRNLSSPA